MKSSDIYDNIVNLPAGSVIDGVSIQESLGSTYIVTEYTVPTEYAELHELICRQRILRLRIIKG